MRALKDKECQHHHVWEFGDGKRRCLGCGKIIEDSSGGTPSNDQIADLVKAYMIKNYESMRWQEQIQTYNPYLIKVEVVQVGKSYQETKMGQTLKLLPVKAYVTKGSYGAEQEQFYLIGDDYGGWKVWTPANFDS